MSKTILIIEDEENLVELLRFRLEANNYRVEAALDGKEGWEKIKALKPDLVILDVMLPKVHGYEVCQICKKDKATKDIPIIMLTARAQAKDMDEAKKAGADAWVTKPFEPSELLAEIKKLIGNR
jgi:DNA-binding response OmpR family regulator